MFMLEMYEKERKFPDGGIRDHVAAQIKINIGIYGVVVLFESDVVNAAKQYWGERVRKYTYIRRGVMFVNINHLLKFKK